MPSANNYRGAGAYGPLPGGDGRSYNDPYGDTAYMPSGYSRDASTVSMIPKPVSHDHTLEPMTEDRVRTDPRYRDGSVTPPPTPEEYEFLTEGGGIPWAKMRTKEFWMQKKVISERLFIGDYFVLCADEGARL